MLVIRFMVFVTGIHCYVISDCRLCSEKEHECRGD